MADFNSPCSCSSMHDNPVDFLDDLDLQIWQFSDQSAIERMATLSDILPVPQNQEAVAGSNSHEAGLHITDMPPPSDPIFTANYSDFQTSNPASFYNSYEDNAIVPALDFVQTTGCEDLLESQNIAIAMIVPPERTQDEEAKNGNSENQQINDDPKRPPRNVLAAAKPPADGHKWRKYGQKQVKNSNFPRSYYRCTHLNCKVTKKIEYSAQGEVAEIIYKGSHGHPKDHASKLLMRQKAVEKRCIVTEEMSSSARSACQPKCMIVIESQLEVLDDGFRWRKYGQKVVKGNTNPRSYYKCTHPECSVRKHIERSPNDSKLLLTTYEGNHEHEIPATREHTPSSTTSHHHMVLEAARSVEAAIMTNREGFVGFECPVPLDMVQPGTISVEQPPAPASADDVLAIVPYYEGQHEHEARDNMSNDDWSLNSRGKRVSSHHHNQAANDDMIMANRERFEYYAETVDVVSPGMISVEQLALRMGMVKMPKEERTTPELGASSPTAQLPLQADVALGYRPMVRYRSQI